MVDTILAVQVFVVKEYIFREKMCIRDRVMRKAKMTKKEKKEKASVKTLAKAIMPPGSTPDGMLLSSFQKKPHRSRYIYPKNLLGNNGYRLPFFPG